MALASFSYIETSTHKDLDCDATAQQVGTGAKTLFSVEIDNQANTTASYVKMWDHAGPTVGTTDPDVIIKVPAGATRFHAFNNGTGRAFATALWLACVDAPGTAGTTGPIKDVAVTLKTN